MVEEELPEEEYEELEVDYIELVPGVLSVPSLSKLVEKTGALALHLTEDGLFFVLTESLTWTSYPVAGSTGPRRIK